MRVSVVLLIAVFLGACQSATYDSGPKAPDLDVRVLRVSPDAPRITLGHHDSRSYIDVLFSILEPEEFRGRALHMKFMPEYTGRLFESREFRLRLPKNVVEGNDRERTNPDGTITVWSDTDSVWNFEALMLEAIKKANQPPEPTSPSVTSRAGARLAPAAAVAHL
jgi:hypothetical protein